MTEFETDKVERGIFANTKLVLFDVGGILFRFMGGVEALSKLTGYPSAKCEAIWRDLDDSICRGITEPQEIWRRIKRNSGYSGVDREFVPIWVDNFQRNDQVHKLIKDVAKHHPVGLMTNIYPGVYKKAIETGNIPNIPYAFVLQSCDTGFVKPEKQFYELAEQISGHKPSDILLIDDSPRFIASAQERGWKTYTFNTNSPDISVSLLRDGFAL